ncbi:MAG: DASH family cryptochrome [Schleiferiaceae bacterium]
MIVWWIRRDQRLNDNACWDYVRDRAAQTGQAPVALFAWNGLKTAEGLGGIPRMSARRQAWTSAGLEALRTNLATEGVDLIETDGSAADWLRKYSATEVVYSRDVATEERRHEDAVRAVCPQATGFWTHTLWSPETLPGGLDRLPPTFTPFRHRVERDRTSFDVDPLPETGARSPQDPSDCVPFGPTEADALARLSAYFANPEGAAQYKTRRNGLLGTEFSTKFSLWLATGALSPQRIWQCCLELEAALGGSPDVEWIRVELLWREYFQWVAYTAGPRLFFKKGFRDSAPRTGFNAKAFQRWVDGTTGDAFVDAGMRELAATGFSSNRARQNMASYLIHDLGLDWRYGAAYFESQLLDYDPASNWANWAYIAGVGNDPRPVRRFNTVKQAQDYDADGAFRRHWRSAP